MHQEIPDDPEEKPSNWGEIPGFYVPPQPQDEKPVPQRKKDGLDIIEDWARKNKRLIWEDPTAATRKGLAEGLTMQALDYVFRNIHKIVKPS